MKPLQCTGENAEALRQEDNACPICLLDDVPLVSGRCQHACCLPCLERILSTPSTCRRSVITATTIEDTIIPDEDDHLHVPTRGRCPICRCELSLFDLKEAATRTTTENLLLAADAAPPIIAKNHKISSTDLKGRVFVLNRSRVGAQSLHFPTSGEDGGSTDEKHNDALPYVDWSQMVQEWKYDSGNEIPSRKYFEPDCHFHQATRTFHGRLRFGPKCEDRLFGSLEWEYILAFSSDYEFISRGVLIQKRVPCRQKDCNSWKCKFLLDGRWQVSWPGERKRSPTTYTVHNNSVFQQTPYSSSEIGRINHSPESHLVFMVWNDSDHSYQLPLELNKLLHAFHVGEQFKWESVVKEIRHRDTSGVTHPSQMLWTRETIASEQAPLKVLRFGADHPSKLYYYALRTDSRERRMSGYHSNTLWGNTFCQAYKVGLASYHFLENLEGGAYISYEHEQTSVWPPLDNGNPIPAKIWFTETSFDAESRRFRGKVDWEGTHNTTWQGCRWWRYEIHFDEDYSCIVGGWVKSVPLGSEVEMNMSSFGVDLLYGNAGLFELCHRRGRGDNLSSLVSEKVTDLRDQMSRELLEQGETGQDQATVLMRLCMLFENALRVSISYPRSFQ